MASRFGRPFGDADVETVVAEASYAEILAVVAACEVDVHAAVEVYTAHTSDLADVSVGYMDNCTVDHVDVAVKESALVAGCGKNRHCLHRQHTADNVQSAGAIQAVDERAAVDQKMHWIHFVDDAGDCAGVDDGHLCLCSTGVWDFLFE